MARESMASHNDAVNTMCAYCGVGCGMVLQVTTDRESGRRHIAKSIGNKEHPANHGRLCTKGATTSDLLNAPGRMESAHVRADRGEPIRARRYGPGDRSVRKPVTGNHRCAWPGFLCHVCVGPDVDRGAVPGEQADQGLHRHQPDRVELAAVHGQRWFRLQALPGRGRPARLVPGLRRRRRLLRHRRQYGRLPSHPVLADDGPRQGRRKTHRGRPAADRDRG